MKLQIEWTDRSGHFQQRMLTEAAAMRMVRHLLHQDGVTQVMVHKP